MTTSSGTYFTLVKFCAERSYNYETMRRWKAEYLASEATRVPHMLQMPSVHHSKSAKALDDYLVHSNAVGKKHAVKSSTMALAGVVFERENLFERWMRHVTIQKT